MIDENHADGAAAADPHAKEGSELATAPAAATGTAEPVPSIADTLPEGDAAAKIDALHHRHFHGTSLANNTEHWNIVHAFKEEVKKLFHELFGSAAKN